MNKIITFTALLAIAMNAIAEDYIESYNAISDDYVDEIHDVQIIRPFYEAYIATCP